MKSMASSQSNEWKNLFTSLLQVGYIAVAQTRVKIQQLDTKPLDLQKLQWVCVFVK